MKRRLLVTFGVMAVGMGAAVTSADAQISAKALCNLTDKAIKTGTESALQSALVQFPGDKDKRLTETLRRCKARLVAAITELTAPAAGPAAAPPPAPANAGYSG